MLPSQKKTTKERERVLSNVTFYINGVAETPTTIARGTVSSSGAVARMFLGTSANGIHMLSQG